VNSIELYTLYSHHFVHEMFDRVKNARVVKETDECYATTFNSRIYDENVKKYEQGMKGKKTYDAFLIICFIIE
jgi:hypothetical protein